MGERSDDETKSVSSATTVERASEREVAVSRSFNAPVNLVFQAWTRPELFQRWWAPKSMGMTILSCEMDVRVGGGYRIEMTHPSMDQPMAFFGRYLEVVPNARLVWTNEESSDGPLTTATFEETDGVTRVVLHELHPGKAPLEGMEGAMPEQYAQLEAMLAEKTG